MAGSDEFIDWHLRLRNLFEDNIRGRWWPLESKSPYSRGDTFERLIGKARDNAALPDFGDIEVKASESTGGSMITLFTKSPKGGNELRQKYGATELGANGQPYKSLRTTFNTRDFTNSDKRDFDFKVVADRAARKVKVVVRNKQGVTVSDGDVYWDFDALENSIVNKLSRVAVIEYELDSAGEQIRYSQLALNEGFTFDKFLQAIDAGDLQVDFRLGQYGSGPRIGKLHDHGTAFRMAPAKFRQYSEGEKAVAARKSYTPHILPAPAKPSVHTLINGKLGKPQKGANICWGCGRPLTSPKSIARGYGPGCAPRAA